jgi:hypothetical protein
MEKSEADVVREIAHQAMGLGVELHTQIELMEAQNSNGINNKLTEAGLENPLIAVRNAMMARIVMMVAREYSKPRATDRNLHRAFDLLKEPSVREVFGNRLDKLVEAEKQFRKCKDDNRLQKIKHFRDKFTAHIGEPEEIPLPLYKELFAFARETIACIDKIAAATGLGENNILDDPSAAEDATEFWKPWTNAGDQAGQ